MDTSNMRESPKFSGDTVRETICDIQESHDERDTPAAITDTGEIDPFTGDHDIEYWIWDGAALIPASPVDSERFREREAMLRLTYWQTHTNGAELTQPRRWHAIVTTIRAALGKLHARLSGPNI